MDDDASVRSALEWLCQTAGYQVATFESAEDFLTGAGIDETDCLVLDVDLPGQSGLQMQVQLRAANSSLPIVFITAFDDEQTRKQAMKAGAVGFLGKPVDSQRLLTVIERALS